MGMYQIDRPFKGIQEYASYPYNKLYWHGKLISKAVTDNWQFGLIRRGIENGELLRAKLADGYRVYNVDVTITGREHYSYDVDRFLYHDVVIARSAIEAEARTTLKYCDRYTLTDGEGEIQVHAYMF